ncbi:PAS domain S-box-containing protein [Marinospirillum celere]|uniref:Sensor protein FixL n=1 Tax=Marinospirillum celere TaxID=1122252 RepID=A0A1I1DUX5_9GAMM|nr:PAS domain S-box protein [Marinospirillum celere]SFB78202.1 PAS domain S-box-containing protein [Marinospirillum celere]
MPAWLSQFFIRDSAVVELIHGHHHLGLTLVSILIAIIASYSALTLAAAARSRMLGSMRRLHLISGALALGAGVWAMHFIGMLAFELPINIHYDPLITALSMLPSLLAAWIALNLLAKATLTISRLLLGGLIVGLGIGSMHYLGMGAMVMEVQLRYDPSWFLLSIVIAALLAMLALWISFGLRHLLLPSYQIRLIAAVVMGFAISGMHYTAMHAARYVVIEGQPLISSPDHNNQFALGLTVAGVSLLIGILITGINALIRYRELYRKSQETTAYLEAIFDTAVDGLISISEKGKIESYNKAAERILGYPASEILGRNVSQLMPEPHHSQHDSYLENYLKTGQAKIIGKGREVMALHKDGHEVPIRLAIGESRVGKTSHFVGFITDISERHAMEQALQEREKQYRTLIDNIPGVTFRCRIDEHWSAIFISESIEELTGWQQEDFLKGRIHLVNLIHPDDMELVNQTIDDALAKRRSYTLEYRLKHKQGHYHWVSESATGVRDEADQLQWIDGVLLDITDAKKRNAEFSALLRAVDDATGVCELDACGRIRRANANYTQILGYQPGELNGTNYHELGSTEPAQIEAMQELWDAVRAGELVQSECARVGKDGQTRWVRISLCPVPSPMDEELRVIELCSDLTQRRQMEIELVDAKERAEEAAAAKSSFLANMSHEIRTPMNSILGFTDLVLDTSLSKQQREHLNSVRSSAGSLLSLLNSILDTAKLDSGVTELENRDFSLLDICKQLQTSFGLMVSKKGLTLHLDYSEQLSAFFKGDTLRIRQILTNLLSNAVKFTEQGEIHLHARPHERGKGVLIEVRDTGIGIPPDRLDKIFDPFAQADASMTRRFGGTGLGTTISKQLAELMGGKLEVSSEVGVGSCFRLYLPLTLGQPTDIEQTSEQEPELPSLSLLIADDVPQNLQLIQTLLEKRGHQVTTAENGRQALELCQQQPFDLVLMDVQMPEMDGHQATQALRAWEKAQHREPLPVIALTASVMEEDRRLAIDAGMNGFASKPLIIHQLLNEVARVLGINTLPTSSSKKSTDHLILDSETGRQLWGSQQAQEKAIQRFLKEPDHQPQALEKLLLENPQRATAEMHRLKGLVANLGLPRLAKTFAELEQALKDKKLPASHRLFEELAACQQALSQADAQEEAMLESSKTDTSANRPELGAADHQALTQLIQLYQQGETASAHLEALATHLPGKLVNEVRQLIEEFELEKAAECLLNYQQEVFQQEADHD